LLPSGYEDLEVAAVLDPCGWTDYRAHLPKVTVVTAGSRPEVRGRFGSVMSPQLQIEQIQAEEYAVIVMPGGFDSHGYVEEAYDPRLQNHFRIVHATGAVS
jgi:4-methyl-5(b-hydroxyethyl)-thiazole monophosphate biosynthesis